jgi:hypothetical protein
MSKLLAPLSLLTALALTGCDSALAPLSFDWPPEVGRPYPELALRGLDGETVELADHRGKVLLIEPIGST